MRKQFQGLQEVVEQYLIQNGRAGLAHLIVAIDRSERTLDRWLKEGAPSPHEAYKLALACGVHDRDALQIARLPSSVRAKASA